MGIIILIILFISLVLNISEINKQLMKIERKSKRRGVLSMSKIIEGLVGMKCKITEVKGGVDYECSVLEVDEEWLKLEVYNGKKDATVVIKRIETIEDITLLNKK